MWVIKGMIIGLREQSAHVRLAAVLPSAGGVNPSLSLSLHTHAFSYIFRLVLIPMIMIFCYIFFVILMVMEEQVLVLFVRIPEGVAERAAVGITATGTVKGYRELRWYC